MRPALSRAISLAILSDHARRQMYSSSIDVQQQVDETHLNKANAPFRNIVQKPEQVMYFVINENVIPTIRL